MSEQSQDSAQIEEDARAAVTIDAAPNDQSARPGKGMSVIGLMIASAALLLSAWTWWQGQQVDVAGSGDIDAQLISLTAQVDAQRLVAESASTQYADLETQVVQQGRRLQNSADEADASRGRLDTWQDNVAKVSDGVTSQSRRLDAGLQRIEGLDRRQQRIAEQMQELTGADNTGWQIEEAAQLLRMAGQRLLLAADVRSAEQLLVAADTIVRNIDDTALVTLRGALAHDIAALRAVPARDLEGLYLRLEALQSQIADLPVPVPEQIAGVLPDALPDATTTGNWRAVLQRVWQRLRELIVVRRRDAPIDPLLPPEQEFYLRQNLRLLLEQSQLALLSANPQIYRLTLATAGTWLSEWFDCDTREVSSFKSELEALRGQELSMALPALTDSQQALSAYRSLRAATRQPVD